VIGGTNSPQKTSYSLRNEPARPGC